MSVEEKDLQVLFARLEFPQGKDPVDRANLWSHKQVQ